MPLTGFQEPLAVTADSGGDPAQAMGLHTTRTSGPAPEAQNQPAPTSSLLTQPHPHLG